LERPAGLVVVRAGVAVFAPRVEALRRFVLAAAVFPVRFAVVVLEPAVFRDVAAFRPAALPRAAVDLAVLRPAAEAFAVRVAADFLAVEVGVLRGAADRAVLPPVRVVVRAREAAVPRVVVLRPAGLRLAITPSLSSTLTVFR
jgi:hypothetical protein